MRNTWVAWMVLVTLAACGGSGGDGDEGPGTNGSAAPERAGPDGTEEEAPRRGPDRVVVDHILIGVKSERFPNGRRPEEEARKLAYDLYQRLNADRSLWAELKASYSEDPPPGGPYRLANTGVTPRANERAREGMVPAFGNVAFDLKEKDDLGIADYHEELSPFGYHILRRVE